MKIPRKTNYKLVKRQRIRAAVHLHCWRKSYLGLHKTLGVFVKGIDIETGKYIMADVAMSGYYPNNRIILDCAIEAFNQRTTKMTGKCEILGNAGQVLTTSENGAFWGEPCEGQECVDPLKSMKEE